jgi:hypothetical protein
LRDFCPLYKIVDSSDCRIDPPPSISIDYANTGQQFSNISKCFRADLWSKSSFQVRDNKIARCHQYACSNGTALFVKIGANWVNCPSGQTISNGFSTFSKVKCLGFLVPCIVQLSDKFVQIISISFEA